MEYRKLDNKKKKIKLMSDVGNYGLIIIKNIGCGDFTLWYQSLWLQHWASMGQV